MSDAETELDAAHAAMSQGGDAERLRFYDHLADSHLFVPLEREAEGDSISPEMFETGEGAFVLAFDQEDRLVQFTGQVTPFAGLSGRVLMRMLSGQGIGLGLNLEVAPSSILIPSQAVDWLNETLAQAPDRVSGRVISCSPPGEVPEVLIGALRDRVRAASGLAEGAWLIEATYGGGSKSHLIGFVGALPSAEPALAKAVSEAVVFAGGDFAGGDFAGGDFASGDFASGDFAGADGASLDVGFFAPDDPLLADMARVGQYFEVPEVVRQEPVKLAVPGSDPDKPPKLR